MKLFISSSNIICWTNHSGYGKIFSRKNLTSSKMGVWV